ncbi:hypothetical protein LB543_27625 [Mesorhizobium sp. ESP7-2]|uniref:hypothetical protein n=1 Tax=Mesorhizobium sp. ESP7-2 TaxID=2876622 RepID=UPI001CCBA8CC|nr:hypothetical protein [Mesorhizobium sp. ESP7-2]MBZ9710473.1 hypothetical protein [Mesorhizobium sp. ESP7-2]
MMESIANLGTAVFGALAAYFWWRVAVEKIPATKALTADMTKIDVPYRFMRVFRGRSAGDQLLADQFALLSRDFD